MPRKMKNQYGEVFTVHQHLITKHFWEYYILDNHKDRDIRFALVLGFENEMGDVSMSEIKPHVAMRTEDMEGVMPPPDWKWID